MWGLGCHGLGNRELNVLSSGLKARKVKPKAAKASTP